MTIDVPMFEGFDPPDPQPSTKGTRDGLSPDQRRTMRQQSQVASGVHPLTRGPLHPEASRERTRESGRRDPFSCGSCVHRVRGGRANEFPKCDANGLLALTHSAGTDVRAWWPACPAYEPTSAAAEQIEAAPVVTDAHGDPWPPRTGDCTRCGRTVVVDAMFEICERDGDALAIHDLARVCPSCREELAGWLRGGRS